MPRRVSLVGLERDRSVRGFDDHGRRDPVGILRCDLAFEGGRHQQIALSLQQRGAVGVVLDTREVLDATGALHVLVRVLDMQAGRINDGAVVLDYGNDLHAVFLFEELRGVVAHVAESLNDQALTLESAVEMRRCDVIGVTEEFPQGELDAAACGLDAAGDAVLRHGLARHAGHGVDLVRIERSIGVGDPGHLASPGAHVGSRDVHAGTQTAWSTRPWSATPPATLPTSRRVFMQQRRMTPVTPRRQAPADLSDKTIGDLDVSRDGLDGSAAAHPNKPGNPATTLLFPSSEIGSCPSRIRCQAATGSWTKSRQWET